MIEIARKEIFQIKLISPDAEILKNKVIKIPKCYPIYNISYKQNLEVITNYLNKIDGLYPMDVMNLLNER